MSFRESQQAVDQWIGQYKEGYLLRKLTVRDAARWTKKER